MNIYLSRFSLGGNWSPLFASLPGWQQLGARTWTDGLTNVTLSPNKSCALGFGFVVCGTKTAAKRMLLGLGRSIEQPTDRLFRFRTPSGIPVTVEFKTRDHRNTKNRPRLLMNHAAANVTDVRADGMWLEKILGPSAIFVRDSAWEPVSRHHVRDIHLFRFPFFYITLRQSEKSAETDHVGWMANSRKVVDEMAEIVKALRWKIVFGPTEIDGSYLFHFCGPDNRVHDFFYPTDALPLPVTLNK